MSEAKHTPGKWMMVRYTGHDPEHHDWPGRIVAEDGTEIYRGPFSFRALGGRTDEEAEANACLIAAAPDLLEVAREILLGPHGASSDPATVVIQRSSLDMLRTAISKAEGREV